MDVSKPDAFESIRGMMITSENQEVQFPELLKNLYAIIREGGWIDLQLSNKGEEIHQKVVSLGKMVGFEFLSVSTNDIGLKINGKKPKFTKASGPAKIRRKPKAEPVEEQANPWANLD